MKKYSQLALVFILCSCYNEVKIAIKADFAFAAKEATYTIPAIVSITNNTIGAETYLWTFEGAEPATSTKKNPGEIVFKKPGIYTIRLEASNFDGVKQQFEQKITINDKIVANFNFSVLDNTNAPATIQFNNQSVGSEKIEWTFEGGNPAISTEKNPKITFDLGGKHKVSLKVFNEKTSVTKDSIIILEPELNADFKLDTAPTDEEYEAPLKINLKNNSQGNTTNKWTFTGADLSSSTDKDPSVLFTKAGSYSISLEVSNGKKIKTFTKDITVNPNKGFHFIKDLKLGISSAQASIGAVFSSSIRKIFKENDKTTKLEAEQIDFAFFGLDSDFSYNQFVSPNTMADAGFDAIANTTKTKILNKQNLLSADDFGKLTLDKLKSLDIKNYNEISKYFGSATPHVVLYETQNGRKGAILIKQQVKDKDNSYIVVDIKVIK